jgi:hypothetical protein
MKKIVAAALAAIFTFSSLAAVVRPAPDFSWQGLGGRLSKVRGQPVVLVIADSPRNHAFRSQVKKLHDMYRQFAAKQVVFAAAFTKGGDAVPSDIPFVIVENGAKVAADYGVSGEFAIAIIGTDGNVDLQTTKVIPATRVREVMVSAFPVQAPERKQ